jgi:hypothetical protein
MPAFAVLQLKNQVGTETPFNPASINPATQVATWLGAGATLDARVQVSHSLVLPTGKSTRVRAKQRVVIPIIDSVSGQKVDEIIVNVDASIPKNSALGDRQNIRAHVADLMTDPIVVAAFENFEAVY